MSRFAGLQPNVTSRAAKVRRKPCPPKPWTPDRFWLSTSSTNGISNVRQCAVIWNNKDRLAPNSGHGAVMNAQYRERSMFQYATTSVNSVTPFFIPVETDALADERTTPEN